VALTTCSGVALLPDAGAADPAFPIALPAPKTGRGSDGAGRATLSLDAGGEYRSLRFSEMAVADVEAPAGGRVGMLLILAGARLRAQLRPSPPAPGRPAGAADLLLEDGTAVRRVPLAAFSLEPEAP
jgi:hypothetical protein